MATILSTLPTETTASRLSDKCIAIGISTGGPAALAWLFAALRPPMPPILVVQHMLPAFTGALAERLNGLSQLTVRHAENGSTLEPNVALLAAGGMHLRVRRMGNTFRTHVHDGPAVSSHKPSIDILMSSVAESFGNRCLGVIMTGMGRDGVAGCAAIRKAGGLVLGQNEESSDVYGMNKIAFVDGHVHRQFSLEHAAEALMHEVRTRWLGR